MITINYNDFKDGCTDGINRANANLHKRIKHCEREVMPICF